MFIIVYNVFRIQNMCRRHLDSLCPFVCSREFFGVTCRKNNRVDFLNTISVFLRDRRHFGFGCRTSSMSRLCCHIIWLLHSHRFLIHWICTFYKSQDAFLIIWMVLGVGAEIISLIRFWLCYIDVCQFLYFSHISYRLLKFPPSKTLFLCWVNFLIFL